jgi:hypothetical protein
VATPQGRRRATAYTTVAYEHIPPELLAHAILGAASCARYRHEWLPQADWIELDGVGHCPSSTCRSRRPS